MDFLASSSATGGRFSGLGLMVAGAISLAAAIAMHTQGYTYFESSALPLLVAVVVLAPAAVLFYTTREPGRRQDFFSAPATRPVLVRFSIAAASTTAACTALVVLNQHEYIAAAFLLGVSITIVATGATTRLARMIAALELTLALLAMFISTWQLVWWSLGVGGVPLALGIYRTLFSSNISK